MSAVNLEQPYLHQDDLGECVGFFHGTPVFSVDFDAAAKRSQADARKRIAYAKLCRGESNAPVSISE